MCCSVALTACKTERIAVASRPDLANAQRMECVAAGERPAVPAEYSIDWSKVVTVEQARGEHDAFVRVLRQREGVVAGYLVDIEGKLFVCSSNAQWWRDYWKGVGEG